MDNELFETGADLDVEDLMALVQEAVAKREVSTQNLSQQGQTSNLKAIRVVSLIQKIRQAGLLTQIINQIPLKTVGITTRLERPTKKLLKWLVHWNTKAQSDFNLSVTDALELVAQQLQQTQVNFAAIESAMERGSKRTSEFEEARQITEQAIGVQLSKLEKLRTDVATMNVRLQRLEQDGPANEGRSPILLSLEAIGNRAEEIDLAMSELETKLSRNMDETRIRLLRAERTLKVLRGNDISSSISEQDERITNNGQPALDHKKIGQARVRKNGNDCNFYERSFDYFLFESKFRGPTSEIRRRQSIYVEIFIGKKNVVDLGCGRGEFVELLSENGVNVTGVDNDQDMVDFCKDKGLRVVLDDAFDYLSAVPEASLDGISAFQVIEHMSVEQVERLISLCWDKLKPSGVILAETVNTNCPMALANFYLDPSHIRPVPAELLRFMFEQRPFKIDSLRFSCPVPGSNVNPLLTVTSGSSEEVSSYLDYAVIAYKI